MNNLIYYPSFEVRDQNWLKFALLYLRNINMIIPESGERYLSREFREIYDSTDLFRIHRPNYDVGYNASLDAIESLQPVLQNPDYYSKRFHIKRGTESIIDKWRNRKYQTFEVFREKYSDEFVRFCMSNGFADHSQNGLVMPKELAMIFMALLAKSIGDSNNLSPITDITRYDYLTNVLEAPQPEEDKVSLAQNVINVYLPRNIDRIPIESLLQLRSSNGFDTRLSAFQNTINQFHSNIENGNITREFIDSCEKPFQEIMEDVKGLSLELVSYGLGTWMIFDAPNMEIPAIIKDFVIAGLAIYTNKKIKIKRMWNHTRNRVLTRRYLTGIRKISFSGQH